MNENLDASVTANRQYKNSVFTLLFADIAQELYCAVTGKPYDPNAKVDMATLSDVLFRGRVNDLAFILNDRLVVLIEHQSSINANMPLRMLQYISRIYERYVDNVYGKNAIYKEGMLKIPRPEFIVLYNGTKEMPGGNKYTMKLSDMFAEKVPVSEPLIGGLDLTVEMFNINHGCNPEMAARCPELDGYEKFIQMVRDNETKELPREEAVRKAVMDCINQNILTDFLNHYKGEVVDMLTAEWDFNLEKEVAKIEAREETAKNIARFLLKDNKDVDYISKATGLTVDDVLHLQYE